MSYYGGQSRNAPMRPGNGRSYQGRQPNDYDSAPRNPGYQQQWSQNDYNTYDEYGSNEYQDGAYANQRRPYQERPANGPGYGPPHDVQERRSYDYPRPNPNARPMYDSGRPDPRAYPPDRGQRFPPGDPNAGRPQSARHQNSRNPYEGQHMESDRQVHSSLSGDYQQNFQQGQDYDGRYDSASGRPWQDPNARPQYPRGGSYNYREQAARNESRNGYGAQNGYGNQWSEPPPDREPAPQRRSPPNAVPERVRKPLIDPVSPSEMNYDNPFPTFPTKKNVARTDDGNTGDNTSVRAIQDARRPDAVPEDTRPLPRTDALPLRPLETNFSRNGRPEVPPQAQWQEPASAADYQPPRPQYGIPQRPGSAPGLRPAPTNSFGSAPIASNNDSMTRGQRPPVGGRVSDSASNIPVADAYSNSGERMPNFDKAESTPDGPKGVALHAASPSGQAPTGAAEMAADNSFYPQNGSNGQSRPSPGWNQSHTRDASRDANYSDLSGNPYQSEAGWDQSRPTDAQSQAYEDGGRLQRATTGINDSFRPPPPRRIMTTDGNMSGAGIGGEAPRGPGSMPRAQYDDPHGQYRGQLGDADGFRGGSQPRFDQDQRGYDISGQQPRGYNGSAPYGMRQDGTRFPRQSPPTGIPPAGTRMDGPRTGPSNGTGFRPRPDMDRGMNSYDQHPEQQQSIQRDLGAPRAGNSDMQPRLPPVRPGLAGSSSSMGGSRPPPIRQYDSSSSNRMPNPSSRPSDNSRNSLEKSSAPPPVTQAELSRLRDAARANPNNSKTQMELAKKLVEASRVLADEGGRADQRTTSKNRANYAAEAHKIVKRQVTNGDPEAMFFLADSLSSGSLGLENDPKEAFNLYQQAAKAGHASSAYRTAVCCEIGPEDGGGTRKDPVKAMQWYKRAAALGDVPAMYKLGMIQLKGLLGQQRNVIEGCTWLKRAADKADEDNPHAVHELALIYESGEGPGNISRDPTMALQLFTQAAKLGYKQSQFRLGQAYEYGLLGCPVDARNSIVWYTRAAAQGEHQSELALSGWYLTGSEGILEHSDTEAYLWARKAALAQPPLPKAMFAMGYFTEVGIGCPRSLDEAKRWYGRAASHRFPKAQERLEELKKGGIKANGGRQQLSRTNKQQTDADCTVM